MQQHCLACERQSAAGNLYCEQTYCPGELSPLIFEAGERLGDIEIVRPVSVLRSAAVYAATRQGEAVYLKVAHQGSQHKERLKREADLLAVALQKKVAAPFLPVLLPPSLDGAPKQQTYAKTVREGVLYYFYLFQYTEAETLRNVLRQQPQLWINHIGWISIGLATALTYLHKRARYHFALSPAGVLVHFDQEPPNTPRILLVDLGLVSSAEELGQAWYGGCVDPGYAAPELIDDRRLQLKPEGAPIAPDARTDVYGLGVLLYEMLIGEPPLPAGLRGDRDVLGAVLRGGRLPMDRMEDVKTVAELAVQATDPKLARRPADPATFGQQLLAQFGPIPEVKKRRGISQRTMLVTAAALLAIAFLVALGLSLAQMTG